MADSQRSESPDITELEAAIERVNSIRSLFAKKAQDDASAFEKKRDTLRSRVQTLQQELQDVQQELRDMEKDHKDSMRKGKEIYKKNLEAHLKISSQPNGESLNTTRDETISRRSGCPLNNERDQPAEDEIICIDDDSVEEVVQPLSSEDFVCVSPGILARMASTDRCPSAASQKREHNQCPESGHENVRTRKVVNLLMSCDLNAYGTKGEIYKVLRGFATERTAIVLPTGDFREIGIWGTLPETSLGISIPACYRHNKNPVEILGWERDYDDCGPKVTDREFPMLFFDSQMPATELSWVSAKCIRELGPKELARCVMQVYSHARMYWGRLNSIEEIRAKENPKANHRYGLADASAMGRNVTESTTLDAQLIASPTVRAPYQPSTVPDSVSEEERRLEWEFSHETMPTATAEAATEYITRFSALMQSPVCSASSYSFEIDKPASNGTERGTFNAEPPSVHRFNGNNEFDPTETMSQNSVGGDGARFHMPTHSSAFRSENEKQHDRRIKDTASAAMSYLRDHGHINDF
ncbi:hypothetical protein AAE478_010093 [Parahypoxylon ruwenzoriense]